MASSSPSRHWLVVAGIAALPTAFWIWFVRDAGFLPAYLPALSLPLLLARAFFPFPPLAGLASGVAVSAATGMGFVFVPVAFAALALELAERSGRDRVGHAVGWATGFAAAFALLLFLFW